ncbi:hypothetical protein MICRO8M_100027 [Microbacterium sp. 8M]|nr:hypothetical protein MICRO8M_100027 [Microbacterium sp. 8M]
MGPERGRCDHRLRQPHCGRIARRGPHRRRILIGCGGLVRGGVPSAFRTPAQRHGRHDRRLRGAADRRVTANDRGPDH